MTNGLVVNFKTVREKWIAIVCFAGVMALMIFMFFFRLGSIPLRIWDEARLANSALHTHLHGFSIITYYDDQPDTWSLKPPVMIWLQAFSIKLFGINEWATRFPAALASLLTGLIVFKFGRSYLGSFWVGCLSCAVFATTFAYVYSHAGRSGDYDALLSLLSVTSCLSFFVYTIKNQPGYLYGFWLTLSLAVLTKSVSGLLFLPGIALYVLFTGRLVKLLRTKHFYFGMLFFLVMVFGYYLGREYLTPGYLAGVWQNELGGRYLGTLESHSAPFNYYYWAMKEYRYSYWLYFLLPAFLVGLIHPDKIYRSSSLFSLLLTSTFWLIISLGQTKVEWYDLPLYPFFAIQIGLLLVTAWSYLKKLFGVTSQLRITIAAMGLLSLIFFTPLKQNIRYILKFTEDPMYAEAQKQSWYLHNAINERKNLNNYVFCYDGYNGQIQFYIRKLRAEGVDVFLRSSVDSLPKGSRAIASQLELQKKIEASYNTEQISRQWGCIEYIIK